MISYEYLFSPDQIAEGEVFALPHEVNTMNIELSSIKEMKWKLADAIADVMRESSESWHDNAPANALYEELNAADAKQAQIGKALDYLIIADYPHEGIERITLGSRVLCDIGGDKFFMDIVGNLPAIRDLEVENVERGSIVAPMSQALLGAFTGESVIADVNSVDIEITVVLIDQLAQQELNSHNA